MSGEACAGWALQAERAARSDRNEPQDSGSSGAVIWCVGLSGSGKSTLCAAIRSMTASVLPGLVLLDGDAVREAFGNDLGFAIADRRVQIGRLRGIAGLLAHQGLIVLVAAVYSEPDLLEANRQCLPGYFEVYLKSSMATLRRRDPKGIYGRAEAGSLAHVVGVDIPWHPPGRADLILDMDRPESPCALARRVIKAVPAIRWRLTSS
jgi:adenylylsulfate kinase-like enzyme